MEGERKFCEEVEIMVPPKKDEVLFSENESDSSLQVSSEFNFSSSNSDHISYSIEIIDCSQIVGTNEDKRINEEPSDLEDLDQISVSSESPDTLFIYSINNEGNPLRVMYSQNKNYEDPLNPLSDNQNNLREADQDLNSEKVSDIEQISRNKNSHDEDFDDDEINPRVKRRTVHRISSSESHSSDVISENNRSKFKTKSDKIKHLRSRLKKISFRFNKHHDYWKSFIKNPDKILKRLNYLEKKCDDFKEIINYLMTFQDRLDLNQAAILSYSERVTRSKFVKETKLNQQILQDEIFENFRKKK